MKKTLEDIAKKYLSIDTLETRRSDSLDFHDCSIWGIKKALEAAYEAGRKDSLYKESICKECGFHHPGGTCMDS